MARCAKDVELLALRQQLTILQRQVGRPKLRASDRALLAAARQVLSPARRRGMLVTPQTPLAGAAVAARAEALARELLRSPNHPTPLTRARHRKALALA